MSWLLRHNWLWSLLAFLLGAAITWFLLARREQPVPATSPAAEPAPEKEEVLVGASISAETMPASESAPVSAPAREPVQAPVADVRREPQPAFSRRMDAERVTEPTLFDAEPVGETNATEPQVPDVVPPGRYGEGSADAVPHQGPPDGFTIKGNAQSMLFHTPGSPYYGRTKPEVWFRSESDAERAGFTKYTRRPRKSTDPRPEE
ncbi:sunset domain-containing protein [Kribbella sp. CA-247076]|uniref:sunset domain-containing protein n=1 Tax=Kribbella sp. CA-247076 TaxID=3239941 RepID=UPI003D8DBA52